MKPYARPLTALLAVAFALFTMAAYGSATGPGTTGNGGDDIVAPSDDTAAKVRALQEANSHSMEVPSAPVEKQPATEVPAAPRKAEGESEGKGDDKGDDEGDGKGHGLGNTYCQSLKGKGGPAFGHCIAAKAHEKHHKQKHRKQKHGGRKHARD